MSDRTPPIVARVLGDPDLARVFEAAHQGAGGCLWVPGDPAPSVVVWWRRGALREEVLRSCRQALDAGSSFLSIASGWGSAVLGPLARGGYGDPCVACVENVVPSEFEPFQALGAAELLPLSGLLAALAVHELRRGLRSGTCSLVGAQMQVTPYSSWGEAAPPVWVRSAGGRKPGCEGCGNPPAARSRDFFRWCAEVPRHPDAARVTPAPRSAEHLPAGTEETQHGTP